MQSIWIYGYPARIDRSLSVDGRLMPSTTCAATRKHGEEKHRFVTHLGLLLRSLWRPHLVPLRYPLAHPAGQHVSCISHLSRWNESDRAQVKQSLHRISRDRNVGRAESNDMFFHEIMIIVFT